MAANELRLSTLNLLQKYGVRSTYFIVPKILFCTANTKNEDSTNEKFGFAKFDEKKEEFLKPKLVKADPKNETFVSLLRNSKFIDLGDPVGKEVIGKIYHVVGDDLYIDFGWKFPTVCRRPERRKKMYVPGAKVRLLIKDLELSAKFLGSDKEITLLEADCVLLGLATQKPKV